MDQFLGLIDVSAVRSIFGDAELYSMIESKRGTMARLFAFLKRGAK